MEEIRLGYQLTPILQKHPDYMQTCLLYTQVHLLHASYELLQIFYKEILFSMQNFNKVKTLIYENN